MGFSDKAFLKTESVPEISKTGTGLIVISAEYRILFVFPCPIESILSANKIRKKIAFFTGFDLKKDAQASLFNEQRYWAYQALLE